MAESKENSLATTFISGVLPFPLVIIRTVARLSVLTLTVAPYPRRFSQRRAATKMARLALGLEFVQQFGTFVGHEKFDRPMLDPEDASHSEWASVCDYLGLDVHLS